MPDSFQQWARDGRLATIALVVVFITWLCFQAFVDPLNRPGLLDQMLWTLLGGWLTNIAFALSNNGKSKDKGDDES